LKYKDYKNTTKKLKSKILALLQVNSKHAFRIEYMFRNDNEL
jgi:hypothetical protein